jgi:hypothetical protein
MRRREIECMEDPDCGFYIHFVPLSETEPYINAHTHGVPQSWPGQLDFQVVVNVGPESCATIFWNLVNRVKEGERFKDGDRVHEVLQQPVLLKKFPEGHPDRGDVLRVLIPNSKADPPTLPGDEGHDPEFFPLQASLDTENLPWGEAPGHDQVPGCER